MGPVSKMLHRRRKNKRRESRVLLPTMAKKMNHRNKLAFTGCAKPMAAHPRTSLFSTWVTAVPRGQLLSMLSTLMDALGLADVSLVSSTSLLKRESSFEKTKPLSNLWPNKCSLLLAWPELQSLIWLSFDLNTWRKLCQGAGREEGERRSNWNSDMGEEKAREIHLRQT